MVKHQRALAFDYGTRQIGVAVGQTLTGSAEPLINLRARDGIPDWDHIGKLIKEWKPDILIVGLPLNMDGSRLEGRFNLPAQCVDERLSTFEAKQQLRDQQRTPGSYRENPVDSLAAALLLETWLASQPKEMS